MYTDNDIKIIEKKLKKFLIFFIITTIIFITVLVVICKNWGTDLDPVRLPVWPAYIAGVVYAVYAVFAWSFIGLRLIKYRSFVFDVINGLERIIEGKVVKFDNKVIYDNDLEYYNIEIKEDNVEEIRLLHLDTEKDIELFEEGKNVKLKIFGNYIKDIIS